MIGLISVIRVVVVGAMGVLLFTACNKEKQNIMVLGNSITFHGAWKPIGWEGNWGMAASEADSDFVHILKRETKGSIVAKNIAYWESDFKYDFGSDSDRFFRPNILVIRLGENVKTTAGYYDALENLVKTFPAERVIVTGTFWPMNAHDSIQQRFASDNEYTFISFREMWYKDGYQAIGKFESSGVSIHPNNAGMKYIATSILTAIEQ